MDMDSVLMRGKKFLITSSARARSAGGFHLLFYSLFLVIGVLFISSYSSSISVKLFNKDTGASRLSNASLHMMNLQSHGELIDTAECDLFNGTWVRDTETTNGGGLYYSNVSCGTIPSTKNCMLHGRPDDEFMQWRWKPDQCTLPRFKAKTFLSFLKGKTMAFIGDSIARNQMESLLCILSSEEIPRDIYKDAEDKFRTWMFPRYNFTLMVLRSEFLVFAAEISINGSLTGSFDLHLDKLNSNWTQHLPKIDYAIFSDAHWFLRRNYFYDNGKLIGCVYCGEAGVQDLGPVYAIQRAFQSAFKYINECEECSGIVVLLRMISPRQFEHGSWNDGGYCNRTRPFSREEVKIDYQDGEVRRIQMEEVERARKDGEKKRNKFEIMDVTRAMLMRPDGHPGAYWGNKWMKGYNDCTHWCLPGPIDTWNELLFELLRRKILLPSFH